MWFFMDYPLLNVLILISVINAYFRVHAVCACTLRYRIVCQSQTREMGLGVKIAINLSSCSLWNSEVRSAELEELTDQQILE